ncbi:MAG: HAD family hydrolase [Thermodesulfovibrionales bacterium]|nr:HAD family hydrolase [Thermodesulfovibrionales bacterium]
MSKNKAVFFDLYGTLINIRTDEGDFNTYEILARYLSYHHVYISADLLKRTYFDKINQQLTESKEAFPEVDVYKIFFDIMHSYGKERYNQKTVIDICMLYRSLTIRRFEPFLGVYEILAEICSRFKTALISDAQWVFTEPEIEILDLGRFFKLKVLSSRFGYKKPDERLFLTAMRKLDSKPQDTVYIGDNPSRDLVGAKRAGMKCVLFRTSNRKYNDYEADASFNDYHELRTILSEIF